MASWKRDFASGLIILVPILVTFVVLLYIYNRLVLVPVPNVESGPVRVVLAIVIFVLLAFSVGYLMRTAVGSVLERAIDDMMNQLPGLRVVYNASKMAVETALSGTNDLKSPVRLEVWDGLRMTAFKTGRQTDDGKDILFLPTAPNITSGFVIEVSPDRYDEIDETVEDALTRILSAGFGEKDKMGTEKSLRELLGRKRIKDLGDDETDTGASERSGEKADSSASEPDNPSPAQETDSGKE